MPRTIYLVVYSSRLFAAHWAVWIPSLVDPDVGKLIHVSGDVRSGFEHQFERNYNLGTTTRGHTLLPIAEVGENYVTDTPMNGQRSSDKIPRDELEQVALTIPAPGPSMSSVSSSARPTGRVQMSNCQDWLIAYVAALVRMNILPQSANSVVQNAPKN